MSTLYAETLKVDFLHLDTAIMKLDGVYAPSKRTLRLIVRIEDEASGKKPMFHGILLKIDGVNYSSSDEVEKSLVSSRLTDITQGLDLETGRGLSLPANMQIRNLQKEFQKFLGDCKRFEVRANPMRDMMAALGGVFGLADRGAEWRNQKANKMRRKLNKNMVIMNKKQQNWSQEKEVYYNSEVLPDLVKAQNEQNQSEIQANEVEGEKKGQPNLDILDFPIPELHQVNKNEEDTQSRPETLPNLQAQFVGDSLGSQDSNEAPGETHTLHSIEQNQASSKAPEIVNDNTDSENIMSSKNPEVKENYDQPNTNTNTHIQSLKKASSVETTSPPVKIPINLKLEKTKKNNSVNTAIEKVLEILNLPKVKKPNQQLFEFDIENDALFKELQKLSSETDKLANLKDPSNTPRTIKTGHDSLQKQLHSRKKKSLNLPSPKIQNVVIDNLSSKPMQINLNLSDFETLQMISEDGRK